MAGAAKPNVDRSCRMTPLKWASEPACESVLKRARVALETRRGSNGEERMEMKEGERLRTDMKRVVVTRETVDQCLLR